MAETAAARGDSKGLFQCVRWLAPKSVRRSIRLRSADGQLLHPREECRMLSEYAEKLFSARRHVDIPAIVLEPLDPEIFAASEWDAALRTLRSGSGAVE